MAPVLPEDGAVAPVRPYRAGHGAACGIDLHVPSGAPGGRATVATRAPRRTSDRAAHTGTSRRQVEDRSPATAEHAGLRFADGVGASQSPGGQPGPDATGHARLGLSDDRG